MYDEQSLSHTKWECKYQWTFENGPDLRTGLKNWFEYYNHERFHQALDDLTPDEVYYGLPHPYPKAA